MQSISIDEIYFLIYTKKFLLHKISLFLNFVLAISV